jgi:hypothetical protein
MKYIVNVSGTELVLNEHQLAMLVTAVQDAEQLTEKHVGAGKGSQGYNTAYVPTVDIKQPHTWLTVKIMADDFVETIKLTMKLEKDE